MVRAYQQKISRDMFSEIKERHQNGEKMLSLAVEFGVKVPYIWKIVHGLVGRGSVRKIEERRAIPLMVPRHDPPVLPVLQSGFIRPPTKAQLMAGR